MKNKSEIYLGCLLVLALGSQEVLVSQVKQEREQVQACVRVGVSLGSVEFEVPVQLEICELENSEEQSEISSTWRVSEAIRIDKTSQEKDTEKRFLNFSWR